MANILSNTIGLIDYGLSNISSIQNCLRKLEIDYKIISSKKDFTNHENYILPGVGSFKKAIESIKERSLDECLDVQINKEKSKILGICLGMQLLYDQSEEDGTTSGLGFINGKVVKLEENENFSVPNIGWINPIFKFDKSSIFLNELNSESFYYFVHKYGCITKDRSLVIATIETPVEIDVIIKKENIFGCQFHPEKSDVDGMQIIKSFLNEKTN